MNCSTALRPTLSISNDDVVVVDDDAPFDEEEEEACSDAASDATSAASVAIIDVSLDLQSMIPASSSASLLFLYETVSSGEEREEPAD